MKKLLRYGFAIFVLTSLATLVSVWFLEGKSFHDALLVTFMLFAAGEPLNLDVTTMNPVTGALMFAQTLLGLGCLTLAFGGIANFLLSEKIARILGREQVSRSGHIIVCGLGDLGRCVVEELEHLDERVVVIDRGDETDYIELVRRNGHTVLLDNLRDAGSLDRAGIASAKSIIICVRDAVVALDVALEARKRRPDIIIVLRLIDQDLAQKIGDVFDVKVALSHQDLAAPAFAAASYDRSVFQVVKIETKLIVNARVRVRASTKLSGMRLPELLQKDLGVLKLISGEERLIFPRDDHALTEGDTLFVTCPLETLQDVQRANGESPVELSERTGERRNHVILCGLGRLGIRVLDELALLGAHVVVVDTGEEHPDHVTQAREAGHEVVLGDFRRAEVLREAGIEHARSVLVLPSDMMLALGVAVEVRRLRSDVILVLRMYDESLAERMAEALDIRVALSTNRLSAPAFAAASYDRDVFQSTRVERLHFVTADIDVHAGSELDGATIGDLLQLDLTLLKRISGEERTLFPRDTSTKILPGDRLFLTCSLAALQEIKRRAGDA